MFTSTQTTLTDFHVGTGMWVAFCLFAIVGLVIDGLSQRGGSEITPSRAVKLSAAWIAAGLSIAVWVQIELGHEARNQYLAGYLIEKLLSVDNLAVIAAIFLGFQIPGRLQKKLLTYGILGAIVFRAVFVIVGASALNKFSFMHPVFGLVLLFTAVKMFKSDGHETDIADSKMVKLISKKFPVEPVFDGDRLTTKVNGRRALTLLGVALIVVELTDVLFAIDSVPAVLAVSPNSFIAFSSNVMAVLGLRALYFLLAAGVEKFKYLNETLAAVLAFVGTKMVLHSVWHISVVASLAIIMILFTAGIGASLSANRRERKLLVSLANPD